uniref:Uncharacterized protein n=1 Tax=Phytophthora ramorum TaxID=164328 RepID=H3GTX0_PHYRM
MAFTLQTVLVLIAALASSTAAETMASTIVYADSDCSGTPLVVSVVESVDCEALECSLFTTNGVTYSTCTTCVSADRETYVGGVFASLSYLLVETFTITCKLFMGANAFLASGECQVADSTSDNGVIATVNEDGSASLEIYTESTCSGTPFLSSTPDSDTVSNHSCYGNYNAFYIGTGSSTSSSSGGDIATSTSLSVTDGSTSSQSLTSTQTFSSSGSVFVGDDSVGSGCGDVGTPISASKCEDNSDAVGSTTASITPSESSSGINTGAIVGVVVAYIMLCVAACILCFERVERFARRLGLRR